MPKSEDERIRELEAAMPELREELSALRAEIGALGVGGTPPAGGQDLGFGRHARPPPRAAERRA